ncbi:MAG: NAD(P)H-hydrate dehydratase [Maritimibacter sp.]
MSEVLTAAQMRAIEQAAIESGAVTGLELMERAGQGVVEAVLAEWPELAETSGGAAPTPPRYLETKDKNRAVVLCGPGNNGGDGFVVARLLAERDWAVELFLYGDPDKLPPDAKVNYQRWRELGEVMPLDGEPDISGDLLVDALFGTGLTRPLVGVLSDIVQAVAGQVGCGRVVAVDAPSGLCMDSGRVLGAASTAGLSVSFHARKLGHVLAEGPSRCGKLVVADIGLGNAEPMEDVAQLVTPRLSRLMKTTAAHKYSHGHALILSGAAGKGGAARLAARGALRVGAGLVTVAPRPGAMQENAARLDAIMLSPVGDAATLSKVLEDARLNALCLGPGLGVERARDLVPVALRAGRATLLDADALTAYADDPAALFAMLHPDCVLTPHGGEFARLFPDIVEKLAGPATKGPAYSKLDATREAAARAGCVVLYKGPVTVIADPEGRASINAAANDRAAPWLATAGSGDVLAGIITGLMARGFAPMEAAKTGAWLHVEAARNFGPGLIAEDLPEELPKLFRELGI